MIVDLHAHSHFSDGTLSPRDLVKRAHAQGVNVLALTDHDETKGIKEAQIAAQQLGIHLVPGVEISCTWGSQTIHVLGLNVDPSGERLAKGLAELRLKRISRAKHIAEKLEKHGVENAWEGTIKLAGTEAVTRTHFARFLIQQGHAKEMGQVFKRWLGRKGKGFVSMQWVDLEEAVAWIKDAGGSAVIAHPARYKMTTTRLKLLLSDFADYGGVGLEVACSSHSPPEKIRMAELANRFKLYASAGSDFHEPDSEFAELGKRITLPESVTPIWSTWEIPAVTNRCVNE